MTSPFSFHFLRKWGRLPTIFRPVGTDMRGSNVHTLCFLREAISSSYPWSHAVASLHWVACWYVFGSSSAADSSGSANGLPDGPSDGLAPSAHVAALWAALLSPLSLTSHRTRSMGVSGSTPDRALARRLDRRGRGEGVGEGGSPGLGGVPGVVGTSVASPSSVAASSGSQGAVGWSMGGSGESGVLSESLSTCSSLMMVSGRRGHGSASFPSMKYMFWETMMWFVALFQHL